MYIFINGVIKHINEARISPLDHGFLYGLGLFETFRTYNGHPFLLDDHFHRLHESALEMGIKLDPYERDRVSEMIKELLAHNNLGDGYFRWNVSAGERGIGLSTEVYETPAEIVYVKELPISFIREKKGVILEQRRNTPEGNYRLKSHHFLNNILAKREVGMASEVEGIFLSESGHVSEGIVSNIFWWKDNVLHTPSMETGALNGITKQFVVDLSRNMGITVMEGNYSVHALLEAEEVFVTNSIQEIVPLVQLEERVLPGSRGSVYKVLHKEYQSKTRELWSRTQLSEG